MSDPDPQRHHNQDEPAIEHIHMESSWGIAPLSVRGQPTTASDAPHDGATGPEPWPTPKVGEVVRLGDDAVPKHPTPYLPAGQVCRVEDVATNENVNPWVRVSTITSVSFELRPYDIRPYRENSE